MRPNSGQVMLLTVVILSGLLLSASTIGGLLMLYQIRQSADIANSTKAIYAADAGAEWRIYKFLQDGAQCLDCPDGQSCPAPEFENNAKIFQASCVSEVVPPAVGAAGSETVVIKSIGEANRNYRALETTLTRELPPLPPPPPSP